MGRTRYRIGETNFPYFLTCTIAGWLPVFTRTDCVEIVLGSWRFLQDAGRLHLFGYVILENHLHFIAAAEQLGKEVGHFKSYTARAILDRLGEKSENSILRQLAAEKDPRKTDRDYQVWQEGNQPKQIVSDDMMTQKLEYMHYNPVKRGYVDDPLHWRYSSARNYAGQAGLLDVTTEWR